MSFWSTLYPDSSYDYFVDKRIASEAEAAGAISPYELNLVKGGSGYQNVVEPVTGTALALPAFALANAAYQIRQTVVGDDTPAGALEDFIQQTWGAVKHAFGDTSWSSKIMANARASAEQVSEQANKDANLPTKRNLVGKPIANYKTSAGRQLYYTPNGEVVSEKSVTLPQPDGTWINIPSIHDGIQYNEDELSQMLTNGEIKPTSVHASQDEAEYEAARRSQEELLDENTSKKIQNWLQQNSRTSFSKSWVK